MTHPMRRKTDPQESIQTNGMAPPEQNDDVGDGDVATPVRFVEGGVVSAAAYPNVGKPDFEHLVKLQQFELAEKMGDLVTARMEIAEVSRSYLKAVALLRRVEAEALTAVERTALDDDIRKFIASIGSRG